MDELFGSVLTKLGGKISSFEDSIANVLNKLQGKSIVDAVENRRIAKEEADKVNTVSFYDKNIHQAQSWIEKASKKYNVPASLLVSIYAQESSAGTNPTNQKINAGKEGWRMGITKTAVDELKRNKIEIDLSTPEGAMDAAAAYLNLRRKQYAYDQKTDIRTEIDDRSNNPQEWYLSAYADPAERATIEEPFKKRFLYYEPYYKKLSI